VVSTRVSIGTPSGVTCERWGPQLQLLVCLKQPLVYLHHFLKYHLNVLNNIEKHIARGVFRNIHIPMFYLQMG
jgi:hypothetical protein